MFIYLSLFLSLSQYIYIYYILHMYQRSIVNIRFEEHKTKKNKDIRKARLYPTVALTCVSN